MRHVFKENKKYRFSCVSIVDEMLKTASSWNVRPLLSLNGQTCVHSIFQCILYYIITIL